MGKIKLKGNLQGSSKSQSPAKGVDVTNNSILGKIGATYTTDKGTQITGSVSKDFYSGKADFPGGSETWKGSGKPYFEIKVEKKFGKVKPDLSQYVDNKFTGGLIKGKPKLTKKGWK